MAEPSSLPVGEYLSIRRCEMFVIQTLQSRSTPTPIGALGPPLMVLSSLPFASNRLTVREPLSLT